MSARNPFEELERLFERMSRQVDETARSWTDDTPLSRRSSGSPMAVDLIERDEEYVATVDLPGFEREDIDLRLTDHTLRIDAEREEITDEESGRFVRHERRHESTSRSLRLPEEVDTEGVSARMHNGVLTITMPRLASEESRHVEIDVE